MSVSTGTNTSEEDFKTSESRHNGTTIVPELKIVIHNPKTIIPSRGTDGSAGLDLAPFCDGDIRPGEVVLVNTGFALEIPIGYYGRIAARSNVLMKGISITGDVDNDYRGNIHLIIINNSSYPFRMQAGVAIAHLIITPYCTPQILTKIKRNRSWFKRFYE